VVKKENKEIKKTRESKPKPVTEKQIAAAILDAMIDGVGVADVSANIIQVNTAMIKMLGVSSSDELVGKSIVNFIAQKDVSKVTEEFKNCITTGMSMNFEFNMKRTDGTEFPSLLNASILKDENGNIAGLIAVMRDISELKRVEQKVEQKEKELAAAAADADRKAKVKLEKAYEEIEKEREDLASSYAELQEGKDELVRSEKLAFAGRMAASVAHEIRNPLTNVSMPVRQLKGFLKSGKDDAKDVDIAMDVILRNTQRLNSLITELINSARPPELSLQQHNIHDLLENVLESNKTKIRSKKIKVVKRFTSKPSKLSMDKEQMERAFSNIIINGIESMRRGGKLTIVTEPDEKLFTVKIQDTGKGIPEEDIIRIFDPFFSSKPDGVGLGLTICYGIIVSHGGTIEVESEPKKGSTFTVSLPMGKVLQKKKKKKNVSTGWERAERTRNAELGTRSGERGIPS